MAARSRAKRKSAPGREGAPPRNRIAVDPAATSLYHGEEAPAVITKGHGTAALGPSDSSDSGSDIQGGPGLNRDDGLMQPSGTTSDPDIDGIGATAGPDIGDANLDSDTDSGGTGERAAAGRDSTVPTDLILRDESDEVVNAESVGDTTDADTPTADELVGASTERDGNTDEGSGADPAAARSYRPAQVGQDTRAIATDDGQPDSHARASEPGETGHARANGKRSRDDVPVFDRGGREDLPHDRRRHSR